MRYTYVLVLSVLSLIVGSPAQALDVCSLVSRTEMATAIGEAISSASPIGPEQDKDSGTQTWSCMYGTTKGVTEVRQAAVVSVAEFSLASAARNYITLENLRTELKDSEVHIAEEKGIGDRAFVFTQEGGMTFSVLKAARYFAVTVAGDNLVPDRLKASLRKITAMLAAKL